MLRSTLINNLYNLYKKRKMNSVIVANILKNLKLSYYIQNKIRKSFLEDVMIAINIFLHD